MHGKFAHSYIFLHVMLLYFFIIYALYIVFISIVLVGWQRLDTRANNPSKTSELYLSIILIARNESNNIANILGDLQAQEYPVSKYEVILIDDHSEDDTENIAQKTMKNSGVRFRCLKNEYRPGMPGTPKKSAITQAVGVASGDIIITTDADCRVGSGWLAAMAGPFAKAKCRFVSGPVAIMPGTRLLENLQVMEFTGLMMSGAALVALKYPLLCNGANMAYRKETFLKLRGFEGNEDIASGDDVFLMQKIYAAYPGSVSFLKSRNAIAQTLAQPGINSLVAQRRRWASKWNAFLLPGGAVLPVFLFVCYASVLASAGVLMADFYNAWILGLFLGIKSLADLVLLIKGMRFCKRRFNYATFLLCEVLYPIYVIIIGVTVHFGTMYWKDRKHKIV